jgi:hypothetical protein
MFERLPMLGGVLVLSFVLLGCGTDDPAPVAGAVQEEKSPT